MPVFAFITQFLMSWLYMTVKVRAAGKILYIVAKTLVLPFLNELGLDRVQHPSYRWEGVKPVGIGVGGS